MSTDELWMRKALHLAKKAQMRGEVPVAALVVGPEGLISYAINTRERQQTPLGHAEIGALHKASQKRHNWRLDDCTLYVTLEPCMMCSGALQQARIKRVVFGAKDPKNEAPFLSGTEVTGGVLEKECSHLLKSFFAQRRQEDRDEKKQKVYRDRASVIVVHKNKLLGFHAIDPTSQVPYFFMPGGAIEPGETASETAVRECFEETGYRIHIDEKTAFERKYDFLWNGQVFSCRTIFYVGTLQEPLQKPESVNDADYHKGVDWIDIKKIPEIFKYNADILWAVQKLLKKARFK